VVLKLHTQRLSRAIFLTVALFALGVAAVMVLRARGIPAERVDLGATRAEYRLRQVRLAEEGRDGLRWELAADQVEGSAELGQTRLRQVRVVIEQNGQRWTVTGDEGHFVQATRDVDLQGNVVVVSSDGLRLETARLRWDGERQRAWTDAPVTLFRSGAVVRGRGLEARLAAQSAEVRGPVRATFGGLDRRPSP
jgi:LPS export ABC transporter protein LptC